MSPEHSLSDLESRIGKIEDERLGAKLAALEQRVSNNEKLLATLAPLATQMATLAVNVGNLDEDVRRVETKFDGRLDSIDSMVDRRLQAVEKLIAEERKTREAIREQERREAEQLRAKRQDEAKIERRWRWGFALSALAIFVSMSVTILSALLGAH